MDFNSQNQWWDNGHRAIPHEGIDIRLFSETNTTNPITPTELTVPAAYAGTVISCVKDFLGHSIFVLHEIPTPDNWQLLTAYGHLTPIANLKPGFFLKDGEILGKVTDSNQSSKVPRHLHFSLALLSPELSRDNLNWQTMNNRFVKLLDPLLIFPENSYEFLTS